MHIGIFGAGAIGCYVGGRLLAAGEDVVFVGRSSVKKTLEAGLVLSDDRSKVTIARERVRFELDAQALRDRDVVIVTLKSSASEEGARELAAVLPKNVVVISLQNGVKNAARIRANMKEHVVLGAMVPFNVTRTDDGRFHRGTQGPLVFEMHPLTEELAKRATKAGCEARVHADIDGVLWGKLLFNLNNAINALAGIPLHQELHDRNYRKVLAAAIDEGRRATKKAGIKPVSFGRMLPGLAAFALRLPTFLFSRLAKAMLAIDPEARSSMWDDLERKRKTEIDELNGEIVRLAEANGVAAPVNRRIVELVKAAEERQSGSPRLSALRIQSPSGNE